MPPQNVLPTEDQILTERTGLSSGADTVLATDRDERSDLAAYRRDRRRARVRRLGTGALGLAILAGIWQLVAMLLADPVFLPSVSQTAASFVHYFNRPYPAQGKPLWFDALISLRRILIGFTAGTAIGVALGTAMSATRVVRHLVDPVIEVFRPLPPLAFIPLYRHRDPGARPGRLPARAAPAGRPQQAMVTAPQARAG